MTQYNTLTAVVRTVPASGRGWGSKVKVGTEMVIKLGPLVVARKTSGGDYSQKKALAEFQRLPGQWEKGDGFEPARALKLVA
jgi:hypothetical protein